MSTHEGQTVLVTGASRGIGAAVARYYGDLGARVGLVARDRERLEQVAGGVPGQTAVVLADLTDRGECRRAVAEVERGLGPVDVLVSCAGILRRDFVEDVTPEDFEATWRLNLGAGLWLTQCVLPGMRRRGRGRIVFVASELGLFAAPTYASYCMGKWAEVGLAEVLHHELAGSGVHVCAVCPGDVRTDQLTDDLAWGPTGGQTFEKAMRPEYVARVIEQAAEGSRPVVIVDKPHLRIFFTLMGGPRGLLRWSVHSAFRKLLAERGPRNTGAGAALAPVAEAGD